MHHATSAAARPFNALLSAHNNIQTEEHDDGTTGNDPTDTQRRRGLAAAGTSLFLPSFFIKPKSADAAATTDSNATPIADFPMRKLRLPKGGLGREYIIVQLYVDGNGPYDL